MLQHRFVRLDINNMRSVHELPKRRTQGHFPFLLLPAELRNNIYEYHFRGTILNVKSAPGIWQLPYLPSTEEQASDAITPTPETPALVRTCKLIYIETRNLYHSLVLYNFPSMLVFVDVLSQWSNQKISAMKRAKIRQSSVYMPRDDKKGHSRRYPVATVLRAFPTLQLDWLLIDDSSDCYGIRGPSNKTNTVGSYGKKCSHAEVAMVMKTPGWRALGWVFGHDPDYGGCKKGLENLAKYYGAQKTAPAATFKLVSAGPSLDDHRKKESIVYIERQSHFDNYETSQWASALFRSLQERRWPEHRYLDEYLGGTCSDCGWERAWFGAPSEINVGSKGNMLEAATLKEDAGRKGHVRSWDHKDLRTDGFSAFIRTQTQQTYVYSDTFRDSSTNTTE